MPIPILIGAFVGLASVYGGYKAAEGISNFIDANDKVKEAERRNKYNLNRLQRNNEDTCRAMDKLGKMELEAIKSFKDFSDLFDKIKNKPSIKDLKVGDFQIPQFESKEIEEMSVGATALLSALGGAAFGTAGGFAAAGATTAAVAALGTASTGTAIASLSGAAATNATLAAIGGGSLAAGGGGVAAGSMILGGATLGVGLLVGGLIFSVVGSSVKDKADKAYDIMLDNERKIDNIVKYLIELYKISNKYFDCLSKVKRLYERYLTKMKIIVNIYADSIDGKVDWNSLSTENKTIIENTVLLFGLLYNMCKVKIVKNSGKKDSLGEINYSEINTNISNSDKTLPQIPQFV